MIKAEILKRMDYIIDNNLDEQNEYFNEYQQLGEQLIKEYKKEDLYFLIDNDNNEIYLTPEMVEYTGIEYLKNWENDYVPDTLFNCEYKFFEFGTNKYFVYGAC